MKDRQRKKDIRGQDGAGVTAIILWVVIVSIFVVLVEKFPQLYILATYEDLPGEWTQVFFFAATFFSCLILIRYPNPYRVFFSLLALACFYVVGEEISWGQRLFSFASPEFFQRHNLQQEVNLHNFITGPVATWPKRIVEISLVAGLVGYGLIYPLLQRSGNRPAQWLADHGLPVPPLYLSPYFVTGALCEVRLFSFNEAEIAELLIAMALVFLTLHHQHLLLKQEGQVHASRGLAMAMVGVTLFALIGAGSMSWYSSWSSPELFKQTQQRIKAGQYKFAGRYSRYGDWRNAANLYERLIAYSPKDRELLRSLAGCFKEMGDKESSRETNSKAIRLDMMIYGRNPRNVPVNLSLFESFIQNGNKEKAEFHLAKAMAESHDKVMFEPYNASSFYWYGRCLELQGYASAAKDQFAKAVSIQPESKKYLKAYRKILLKIQKS